MPAKGGGKIRIIGGQWKRTPIAILDSEGLRPTGDRQKETLFNWLEYQLEGGVIGKRSLDLFAGSGALSFEMASRGAAEVVLIEKNPKVAAFLQQNKEKLQAINMKLLIGDALRITPKLKGPFDVVFIDPPFAQNLHENALNCSLPLLGVNGLVYIESPNPFEASWFEERSLELIRFSKSGHVCMHLARVTSSKAIL